MKVALVRRKELLKQLGSTALASRASWSHDLGSVIVFDAWDHQWERDEDKLVKYALRTTGPHYNPGIDKGPSHRRWQNHVDLVLGGKRALAILPVANDKNQGAKGWRPLVVYGRVKQDEEGSVWLHADKVVPADQVVSVSLPDAVSAISAALMEGALHRVVSSQYERNPVARLACIAHYGAICFVCGFSFETSYGEIGRGFIHVHHLVPVSSIGETYQVNPIKDLRPVCPNCHAMLHRKDPPLPIEDLQALVYGKEDA